MRYRTLSLVIVLLFVLASMCAAQQQEKLVNLDLKEADVKTAIETLMKDASANYSIDPGVRGTITLQLKDVPWSQALKVVLKAAGLVYRVDGGVYMISPRPALDVWGKVVNVEFKQTSLGDAIDTLLKDSGISYTVDQEVRSLTVSAVLRDITLQKALEEIAKAAGARYTVDNGMVSISSRTGQAPVTLLPSRPMGYSPVALEGRESRVITPNFLNPGDVAPLFWQGQGGGAQVTATSGGKLVITGTKEEIDRALDLIKSLDTESVLARPIRIDVVVEITPPGGAKPLVLKTGSVGAEGSPMPLNIGSESSTVYEVKTTVVGGDGKAIEQKTPQFLSRPANLLMDVMPTVDSTGRISVVGGGRFQAKFPGAKELDTQSITKEFQIAASLEPGKPFEVASGSAAMDTGNASFTIKLTAKIEPGFVPIPPPGPKPGSGDGGGRYGGTPGVPPGQGGGGYGGGGGGYGGGGYRTW